MQIEGRLVAFIQVPDVDSHSLETLQNKIEGGLKRRRSVGYKSNSNALREFRIEKMHDGCIEDQEMG